MNMQDIRYDCKWVAGVPSSESGLKPVYDALLNKALCERVEIAECEYPCSVQYGRPLVGSDQTCPACGSLLTLYPSSLLTGSSSASDSLASFFKHRYEFRPLASCISCRCGAEIAVCVNGYIFGCAYPLLKDEEDSI